MKGPGGKTSLVCLNLDSCPLKQLKALCKLEGLPVSGSRAMLVNRMHKHMAKGQTQQKTLVVGARKPAAKVTKRRLTKKN